MSQRTPPPPRYRPAQFAQRRASGARIEVSTRVVLRQADRELEGWALNISRGGIRVVVEERVLPGQQFVIEGYDPNHPDAAPLRAEIVWVQDEPDGAVVGLRFLDTDGRASDPRLPSPSGEPDPSLPPSSQRGGQP